MRKNLLLIGLGALALLGGLLPAAPAQAFFIRIPDVVLEFFSRSTGQAEENQEFREPTAPANNPDAGIKEEPREDFKPDLRPGEPFNGEPPKDGPRFDGPGGPKNPTEPGFKRGPGDGFQREPSRAVQPERRRPGFSPDNESFNGESDGEQNAKQQEQSLKEMKRGLHQMANGLKKLKSLIENAEKKGTVIPDDIKQQLTEAAELLQAIDAAKTAEELEAIDVDRFQELMQTLEEFRRTTIEQAEQLKRFKQGLRHMKQGVSMFERQIKQLTAKKIAIPSEVQEALAKFKELTNALDKATTLEEAESSMEQLQEIMSQFDQFRQQLEVLSRWPQTEQQVKRELIRLKKEVQRSEATVAKLAKTGFDLSGIFTTFKESVTKLEEVYKEATAKMQSGNSEEAFDLLENEFFGQMGDAWQHFEVIQNMNGLAKFPANFKREIAAARQKLARTERLAKNGEISNNDLSEARTFFADAKSKGEAVLELLKAKPINQEAVLSAMEDVEEAALAFEDKIAELLGEDSLPWEKGPQQFKNINFSKQLDGFFPSSER